MARNVDIKLRRSAVPGRVPLVDQLNLGELAVNTADGKLYLKRAYDGVEQVIEVGADARSGLVSTFNTYIYTSDGTLQNITGADDYGNYLSYDLASPRRIQVYLNGVLLHQGIDYTATDGSSISLGYPVDEGMVVQIAAYNSDGASIDADLILDDGFSFTVGTDEETKFYHNGSNTVIKHNAYGDNTFKMLWRDSDRLEMGEFGISLTGNLTINGNTVVTDSDVLVSINDVVTKQYVEDLNLEAKFASDIISLTANFDGVLSGNDDTVQKALETIDGMTTSVVTEGNNLYFTDERARLAVDGSSTIDYNSTTGVISANTNILATRNYAEAYAEAVSDSDSLVTLLSANNYTDQAISDLDSDFNSELNNLQSAVDSDLLVLETSLQSNIDSAYGGAIAHADTVALNAVTTAETYTDSAINLALTNLVDGAPEVLDTLNELAEAMGNDSDFVGTVQNWINQKLDKTATTDVITEGANNQYFTEERSRNSVSAGNGLLYNPVTGEFSTDSSYDAVFNSVTSSVFVGDLNGTATNANQLDGQDGSYYRTNVYDQTGNLIN